MTDGIPASSSTAGFTIPAILLGAVSAKKIAVHTPIGTPMRIAANVPTIDVRMTYRIPKEGSAAAGFHTVPNRISVIPILARAGVPLTIIYAVIETTASTATNAQHMKMICAADSTADLFL